MRQLVNPRLAQNSGTEDGGFICEEMHISCCVHDKIINRKITKNKKVTIGRDSTNDIVVSDVTVSSLHCEFFWRSNDFFVRDLHSSNKTIVQRKGHSFEATHERGTRLKNGDRVLVGKTEIWVTMSKEI